jgi:hypothetical protein
MADISTAPITGDIKTQTVRIDSDLSDKEYYAVDFDGTDRNVVNLVADGDTQGFILITAGDGSSTPTTGVIVLSGPTKAKIVGTVAAGDPLRPSTGGALIKNVTDTKYNCATALEAGVTGDVIRVMANQGTLAG